MDLFTDKYLLCCILTYLPPDCLYKLPGLNDYWSQWKLISCRNRYYFYKDLLSELGNKNVVWHQQGHFYQMHCLQFPKEDLDFKIIGDLLHLKSTSDVFDLTIGFPVYCLHSMVVKLRKHDYHVFLIDEMTGLRDITDPLLLIPYRSVIRLNHICPCSDDSVNQLLRLLAKFHNQFEVVTYVRHDFRKQFSTTPASYVQGMIDVLLYPMNKLPADGQNLVRLCEYFLYFVKKDPSKIRDGHKYITIWSFIYDFLKIPRNSGYDYYLLTYLDLFGIMEHGSGIRCGWYPLDETDITIPADFKQQIIDWIAQAPDDI